MSSSSLVRRVRFAHAFGSLALLPVGLAIVGVLTDTIGLSWVFLAGGALNTLLELIAFAVPSIRKLD
ncbi:MAG TPA: hypothetical protein VFU63_13220 [Ktedonobacterales bacterium]|nr:hypothetical protein [Ktedonobacterales bacterium]